MVKKFFLEKLAWSIFFSFGVALLSVLAIINENLNLLVCTLILIFAAFDGYFIFSCVKFYKYMVYEKMALEKDKKVTATYLDKKSVYKLGDFEKGVVVALYKIQFSFVNELGEMVVDETLPIFSKEQAENLENRGIFNAFIVGEKKAIVVYDKI